MDSCLASTQVRNQPQFEDTCDWMERVVCAGHEGDRLDGRHRHGQVHRGPCVSPRPYPVFDADATVHRLQGRDGAALPAIAAAFPGTVVDGVLDRARLRGAVIGDNAAMRRLEGIIHPLVRDAERRFVARARRARATAAVLDIPLLLEGGGEKRVDIVVVVSAPRSVQVARVRRRLRMTPAQIEAIIARQMPDAAKRRRADLVVHTGLSRFAALRPLRRLIRTLRERAPIRTRSRL